jgi:hypothetical protein
MRSVLLGRVGWVTGGRKSVALVPNCQDQSNPGKKTEQEQRKIAKMKGRQELSRPPNRLAKNDNRVTMWKVRKLAGGFSA